MTQPSMPKKNVRHIGLKSNTKTEESSSSLLNKKSTIIPDFLDSSLDIFSTDISNQAIAFANSAGLVEIFDPQNECKRLMTLAFGSGHAQSVMAMKFVSEGQLVTGDTGGNLCLYDLEVLREKQQRQSSVQGGRSSVKNYIGNPDLIIEEFDKDSINEDIPIRGILPSRRASLYSQKQSSRSSISSPKFGINCLDFNKQNSILAIGQDRTIRLYDKQLMVRTHITRRELNRCDNMEDSVLEGHSKTPHCCKFIDEDLFVTSGWDDCLKVWDRRCPELAVVSINGTHVCGPSIDVQPGSDNKVLCVGNWRSTEGLQLWDLRKAGNSTAINNSHGVPESLLATPKPNFDLEVKNGLPNQGHMIYAVRFLNRNVVLAGGSGEGAFMAVDVNRKEMVDSMDFKKRGINSISIGSNKIVVGGAKGAARVIPID